MKKIVLLAVSILLLNCSNDSLEFIENQELGNIDRTLQERKKNKFKEVYIPLNQSSFEYRLEKKDSKIDLQGYLVEITKQYPLLVRLNKDTNKKRLVIRNNTNTDMYFIVDKEAVNKPLIMIKDIILSTGVSITGPDKAVRVPKGKRLIVRINKKKNRYRFIVK